MTNAFAFLDEPGEWYLDVKAQQLLYAPPAGRYVPGCCHRSCTGIFDRMQGTIDHPVSYITFKNISFQHTTWLRPQKKDMCHYKPDILLDAYKLEIPGTRIKRTGESGMDRSSSGSRRCL
ncbi:hypothetical protein [Chitinophaga pinensis]|uniref:hypothetical protein n=1 Tax=Chitinophaga pinensis TaxID=79329 RepID=UPI00396569AF